MLDHSDDEVSPGDIYEVKDIYIYPESPSIPFGDNQERILTIGDLHGNTIKLIHTLIDYGIANIDKQSYDEMVSIYKRQQDSHDKYDPESLEDIKKFEQLVKKIEFSKRSDQSHLIRLIGDTLADRGANDLLTLFMYRELEKNLKVEILLSNHDMEFLKCFHDYLTTGEFTSVTSMSEKHMSISLTHMVKTAHENEYISTVEKIMIDHYLPNLKILGYEASTEEENNELLFISHAPVGLPTMKKLAAQFGIKFEPVTINDYTTIIDNINSMLFRTIGNAENFKHNFGNFYAETASKGSAVNDIIWKRPGKSYDIEEMPSKAVQNIAVFYFHGHHTIERRVEGRDDHIIGLDNLIGKGPYRLEKSNIKNSLANSSQHVIMTSGGNISPKLNNEIQPIKYNSHFSKNEVSKNTKENIVDKNPLLEESQKRKFKSEIFEYESAYTKFEDKFKEKMKTNLFENFKKSYSDIVNIHDKIDIYPSQQSVNDHKELANKCCEFERRISEYEKRMKEIVTLSKVNNIANKVEHKVESPLKQAESVDDGYKQPGYKK